MLKTRRSPAFDAMEERLALSSIVTTRDYRQAKADIRAALRANDEHSADLIARAAARIPSGSAVLLPAWNNEAARLSRGATRPDVRASIFRTLDSYLHRRILAREIVLKGPAAQKVSRPAIAATDPYTEFVNLTGLALNFFVQDLSTGKVIYQNRDFREGQRALTMIGDPDNLPLKGYRIEVFPFSPDTPATANVSRLADVQVTFSYPEFSPRIQIETRSL